MGPLRVFLDANILFSAALGGASFDLLWELGRAGRIGLVASPHCVAEARRNLERRRPDALPAFLRLLTHVEPVGDAAHPTAAALALLPEDDALVFDAAAAARADVLLTGDLRHFGALTTRDDLGLRVRTVREFLLDGP